MTIIDNDTKTGGASSEARSSLRQRHLEQTRDLIFQALTDQLAKSGFSDFNIASLARQAGVSVRTIYRHFSSKDDLLDELAHWLDDQIAAFPSATTVEDLEVLPETLFRAFDENATVLLAQSATPAGRAVRARGRRRHIQLYREVLGDLVAGLPPGEARGALAVITYLLSMQAWRTMREEFDMDGSQSGKAVAWAVRTLIADLRHRSDK
jgi:AcrR family transcriptional regulator